MNMNNTSWQSTKLHAIQLYRNFATILWWCGKAMGGRNAPISKPESQHMNASWLSWPLVLERRVTAALQFKLNPQVSVVTVSLVPSQCSDTRVSNTQKTIDLEDDQMLHTHAFNFSQLLASATTTTIHNKNIRSSYQCFISFWNIMKTCRQWTLYSLR